MSQRKIRISPEQSFSVRHFEHLMVKQNLQHMLSSLWCSPHRCLAYKSFLSQYFCVEINLCCSSSDPNISLCSCNENIWYNEFQWVWIERAYCGIKKSNLIGFLCSSAKHLHDTRSEQIAQLQYGQGIWVISDARRYSHIQTTFVSKTPTNNSRAAASWWYKANLAQFGVVYTQINGDNFSF